MLGDIEKITFPVAHIVRKASPLLALGAKVGLISLHPCFSIWHFCDVAKSLNLSKPQFLEWNVATSKG